MWHTPQRHGQRLCSYNGSTCLNHFHATRTRHLCPIQASGNHPAAGTSHSSAPSSHASHAEPHAAHAHPHPHRPHEQRHPDLRLKAIGVVPKPVSTAVSSASYQMLKVLSLPTYGKLALVLCCTAPIVLAGAALYSAVGRKDWPQAVSKAFHTVTECPEFEEEDDRSAARVLMSLHMIGILTFASVIGILSNDVAGAIERLNKGNFALQERSHTVLLGWNKHTISMLRQILVAQKERRGSPFGFPVVVLADREKEEMDEELADELGQDVVGAQVITRSGSPLHLSDMERVSARTARTVVVMSPEGQEGEALAAETRLAVVLCNLHALTAHHQQQQNIILESFGNRESLRDTAAGVLVQEMAAKHNIATVEGLQNLQDLMAQCSLQPGLSNVLLQLSTQSEGSEFYVKRLPRLDGRSFGEARRMFDNATLCGIFNATGALNLNPSDTALVCSGDSLLFLAANDADLTPLKEPYEAPPIPCEHLLQEAHCTAGSKHIVVLSHAPSAAALVASVQKFAPPGSRVTVVTQGLDSGSQAAAAAAAGVARGPHVRHMQGSLSSSQVLIDAGVREADSVIINNLAEGMENLVADAQVVATVLQLQGALSAAHSHSRPHPHSPLRTRPLAVVCCISDPDTAAVLRQAADLSLAGPSSSPRIVLDVIDNSKILGGMLTQIGAEPLLQEVFAELLDSAEGNEAYMRDVRNYGLAHGVRYEWAQVQEAVRAGQGELLLGYTTRCGEAMLSVPRRTHVAFEEGDALVVLARQ